MGNCLETKLKGSVNNDNLEEIGYFYVKCHVGGSSPWYAETPQSQISYILTIVDTDKYFTQGNVQKKSIEVNGTKQYFYYPVGDYTIKISNKYNLTLDGLYMPGESSTIYTEFNTDDCEYVPNFAGPNDYQIRNVFFTKGQIEKLVGLTNLKFANFRGQYTSGNLNSLGVLPHCQSFAVWGSSNIIGTTTDINNILKTVGTRIYIKGTTNITGNISALADCTKVNNIYMQEPELSGDLDALFTTWSTAGKTGNCVVNIAQYTAPATGGITGEITGDYVSRGRAFSVTFNGDGTWNINS